MGRRRWLLIAVAVVVAIPLLAALGIGVYLQSGGLERELAHAWTAYGMPGELRVGRIRLLSPGAAEAEEVAIGEPGQPPLAVARRVRVDFDALDRRVLAVHAIGVQAGLDARRWRLLEDLIRAEEQHPPHRAPRPLRVEVADGRLELPGGLAIDGIALRLDGLGPETQSEIIGAIAGHPLRLAVRTARASVEAPVVVTVEVLEGKLPPRAALDAVSGLGLAGAVGPEADPWLPALVELAGTRVERDAVSDTARGELRLRWAEGEAAARLDLDRRQAALRRLAVRDARYGELAGELTAARDGSRVLLAAERWQAGPALPLPPGLPLPELARLLPRLSVRWPVGERQAELALAGANRAQLVVRLGGGRPPALAVEDLPLALAASLLPAGVAVAGGQVVQATALLAPARQEVSARLSQVRVLAGDWAVGPIDAQVAAVLTEGLQQATLAWAAGEAGGEGAPPLARLTLTRQEGRLQLGVVAERIERVLARLRGPAPLPDLGGRIEGSFTIAPGEPLQVALSGVQLSQGALRLPRGDLLRGLEARLGGQVRVHRDAVAIALDGQLAGGELYLPGRWQPIAEARPRFTFACRVALDGGTVAAVELERLLLAAGAPGERGGYSAQFSGRLQGEPLAGELTGVIDHAPLGALAELALPPAARLQGEGAAVLRVRVGDGALQEVEGVLLPLGVDLELEQGLLRIDGITGGVRFRLAAEAPAAAP